MTTAKAAARIPQSQKKILQLGIRWEADRKEAWDKLASRDRRAAADMARLVLEEYMTSFMPREEAVALRLESEWLTAGLLELAMDQRRNRRSNDGHNR